MILTEYNKSVIKEAILSEYPQIESSTVDLVVQTFPSLSDCLQNLYFISNVDIDQTLLEKKYEELISKTNAQTSDELSNDSVIEACRSTSKTPPPVDNAFSEKRANDSPKVDYTDFDQPPSVNLSPVSSYTTDHHSEGSKSPQPSQSDVSDSHSLHSNNSTDLFSGESSSSKPSSKWSSSCSSSVEPNLESHKNLESHTNSSKTDIDISLDEEIESQPHLDFESTESNEYDDEFNSYVEFLTMSFPNISKSVISQTLLDNDKDPARASDVLLSYDTLTKELEKANIKDSANQLSSSVIDDDDPIKFLKTSFPDMTDEQLNDIFKSNNEDLVRSLDDLLSMQAISTGEIEHDIEEFDPLTFLRVSFPEARDEDIEKAFKENNGDVLAASEELLNMDLIREISNQNIEQASQQKELSSAKSSKKTKKDRFRPAAEVSKQKNIDTLCSMFDLSESDALRLYESHGENLYSTMDSIMSKSNGLSNRSKNRALTKLDMKIKQTDQFFSNVSESYSPSKSITQNNSYAAAAASAPSVQRPDIRELERIRAEEKEARMSYIRQATEAYKKSSSNPLYRSVAGHYMGLAHQHAVVNSARLTREFDKILEAQTFQYSIDLHNLSVTYAVNATRLKLENWWTSECSSGRRIHPLRIVTGAGRHSLDEIPRIKLAVEKLLNEEGWKYDKYKAHFDVYGPKR